MEIDADEGFSTLAWWWSFLKAYQLILSNLFLFCGLFVVLARTPQLSLILKVCIPAWFKSPDEGFSNTVVELFKCIYQLILSNLLSEVCTITSLCRLIFKRGGQSTFIGIVLF